MRFGLVHRVMTNALAALGVLALVSSGELSRGVNAAILFGLAGALTVPESWHPKPWLTKVATFGPTLLLAVQITRAFLGRPLLDLAVEFAAALQIVRLITRRGAAHDQQVIVLALLHLVAGTVLGGGLGYGLCFLGFLVVAPGALVLSHLRREVEGNYRQGARDRTGLPVDVPRILRSRRVVGRAFLATTCLLAVPILLFTGAVFLIFPRVGLSLLLLNHAHAGRMIGFSDRVDLGGVGMLRDDPTLALRIEMPDLGNPVPDRITLYLRGTALDAYDGRAWSHSNVERRPALSDPYTVPIERYPDAVHDRVMHVDLEPIEPTVLFLPLQAVALHVRTRNELALLGNGGLRIDRGPEREFRYRGADDHGVRYDIFLPQQPLIANHALSPEERVRYLSLPPLPSRIADRAAEWAKDASGPIEKARAIEARLRTEYRYDLSSPSSRSSSPLDDFLFESKRGHCEFYSTAMAVLLRYAGVPTRNVTGFIGGTYNRFGHYYAVRQGDAHSWVEAYIDGYGWATFDPTPPADAIPKSEFRGFFALVRDMIEAFSQHWDRHVVGYDLHQQLSLFARFREFAASSSTPLWGHLPIIASHPWALVSALFVITSAGAGAWYWRHIQSRRKLSRKVSLEGHAQDETLATSLYELLDNAMVNQGLARPQGIPPLRHAQGPAVQTHPCGSEILGLTHWYLHVRFGGAAMDLTARREFEQRIKRIRDYRGALSNEQPQESS